MAEHRISGDILCMVDSETLKKIGITSTGQRISILKAIYNLKIAHDIPLDAGDYVPPCQFLLPIGSLHHFSCIAEVQALKTLSVTVEDQGNFLDPFLLTQSASRTPYLHP